MRLRPTRDGAVDWTRAATGRSSRGLIDTSLLGGRVHRARTASLDAIAPDEPQGHTSEEIARELRRVLPRGLLERLHNA